jgi:putative acetyltransferase
MIKISVRLFREDDLPDLGRIYFDAVREGTKSHYSKTQRHAWAHEIPDGPKWLARLSSQIVYVAEQDNRIAGFMTLQTDGYIDLAFVAPDLIGRGVAHQLYLAILKHAKSANTTRMSTHASHLARPFFERQGWTLIKEQSVTVREVALTNFIMEKVLD